MTKSNQTFFNNKQVKKKVKIIEYCLNLRDDGDSTAILYSPEHTAREVRILKFYKVEVVQESPKRSIPPQITSEKITSPNNNIKF